jgi:hypothetical protein
MMRASTPSHFALLVRADKKARVHAAGGPRSCCSRGQRRRHHGVPGACASFFVRLLFFLSDFRHAQTPISPALTPAARCPSRLNADRAVVCRAGSPCSSAPKASSAPKERSPPKASSAPKTRPPPSSRPLRCRARRRSSPCSGDREAKPRPSLSGLAAPLDPQCAVT